MTKKDNGESYDFSKIFKVLNLQKRMSVLETAKTLLKVQKTDTAVIDDAALSKEAGKTGLA